MTGRDLLRLYLDDDEQGKRGPTWLAEKLGCTPDAIWAYLAGRRKPELRIALALEELTGGAVPASAWVEPKEG